MNVKDCRVILSNEVKSLFNNYGRTNLNGLIIINNFQNKQCCEFIVGSNFSSFLPGTGSDSP